MGKTTSRGKENSLCQKLVQEGRDASGYYIGINLMTFNPIYHHTHTHIYIYREIN